MPSLRLGFTLLASATLAIAALPAAAQHVPRARRIGAVVVGDARLELLAYDDGTVTAGTSSTMTSAMARWRGDELRAWLDTASAVLRCPQPTDTLHEVTVATTACGWCAR